MQGWGIPETAKADLDARVDVLDLTPKPANVLAGLRISSIGGLLSVPKPKLLANPGFGSQSMAEVERKVSQYLAGKFADFIVLDKDYMTIPMTIPEDQIKDIRVLMAVVGGKTVHLVPSLAREIGMQPAGAQVELGGPGSRY